MKVGQRIAKLLDSDRVYEKKADGTEVLNRTKTLAKNATARNHEVDRMQGDALAGVSMAGFGALMVGGTVGLAETLNQSLSAVPPEPSVLSAVMVGVSLVPGALFVSRAAWQGLLAAKDSIDHAVYAHLVAKDSIHTP